MPTFAEWLAQDKPRIVCLELTVYALDGAGAPGNITWESANFPYVDSTGYTWDDAIMSMGDFSRSVGHVLGQTTPTVSFGDIEQTNDAQRLDGLARSISQGYPLTIKIGDPSWAIGDFVSVFSGRCAGVVAPSTSRVLVKIKENTSWDEKIQADTYTVEGDGVTAVGKYKPWASGVCFNVEPVLIHEANRTYDASQNDLFSIDDIKDGGESMKSINWPMWYGTYADSVYARQVADDGTTYMGHGFQEGVRLRFRSGAFTTWPAFSTAVDYYVVKDTLTDAEFVNQFKLSLTAGGAPIAGRSSGGFGSQYVNMDAFWWYETPVAGGVAGSFTLLNNPIGQVTCDITGKTGAYGTTYLRDAAATALAKAGWTAGMIDFTPIDGSGAVTCNQAGGIFLRGGETISQVLGEVGSSIGVLFFLGRTGKITCRRFENPDTSASEATITADDIAQDGVSFDTLIPPVKKLTFGVRRNFTPMGNVFPGVTQPAANYLRKEYAYGTTSLAARPNHINLPDPPLVRSLLTDSTEAAAECTREIDIYDRVRAIYQVNAKANAFALQLGQVVTVKYNGATLDTATGKKGIVVGITENYITGQSKLKLFMGVKIP